MGKLNNEEGFSSLVLVEAKKIFDYSSQKYLSQSRMEKLVVFVAKEVEYEELTRGWYKFGLFAPSAWKVSQEYSGGGNLNDLFIPYQHVPFKEHSNILPKIRKSISNYRDFFIKEKEDFYNWIYSTAPKKYQEFYFSKMLFENNLDKFRIHFDYNYPGLEEEYLIQIDLISRLYDNLSHVSDNESITLFNRYMDLVEMVLLKIRNINYKKTIEGVELLDSFSNTFKGTNGLLTLLVPFKETLEGSNVEEYEKWMDMKIFSTKEALPLHLNSLYDRAKSLDLIPTSEELEEDIKKLDDGDKRSIRDLL